MVEAVVFARALDGLHIQRFGHHTDQATITPLIVADGAGISVGNIMADRAEERALLQLGERIGQIQRDGAVAAQQKIGQSAGRLWPNPG